MIKKDKFHHLFTTLSHKISESRYLSTICQHSKAFVFIFYTFFHRGGCIEYLVHLRVPERAMTLFSTIAYR